MEFPSLKPGIIIYWRNGRRPKNYQIINFNIANNHRFSKSKLSLEQSLHRLNINAKLKNCFNLLEENFNIKINQWEIVTAASDVAKLEIYFVLRNLFRMHRKIIIGYNLKADSIYSFTKFTKLTSNNDKLDLNIKFLFQFKNGLYGILESNSIHPIAFRNNFSTILVFNSVKMLW